MPELLHRRASSLEPPTPAAPDHGTPGKQTRTAELAAAAVASPSALSRVKAQAGKEVHEGPFVYRVGDRGEFVVTAAPEAAAHAKGRVITSDGAYATAWRKLAEQLLFPDRRTRAQSAAAPVAPFPSMAPVVDAIDAAAAPFRVVLDLFGEPGAPAPATAGTGRDANLVAAEKLVNETAVPHSENKTVDGDPAGWKRRQAIEAGDAGKLKTIVCSELTTLTLQKAGLDLQKQYLDPTEKLPVGYHDEKGNLVFVDVYRLSMHQGDALEAILVAQHGQATVIEPGSDEAKKIGSKATYKFLYVKRARNFEMRAGDVFGAGAAAVTLGGKVIDEVDRKPGDVQQWVDTRKGQGGRGHSSQIWSVRGKGVAYLGAKGSPSLKPDVKDVAPGWYAVDGVYWDVGPDTDPAMVASLAVEWVQLIEANYSDTDATRIDTPRTADKPYDAAADRSRITSAGRLPASKWFGWEPSTPAIAGTITPGGVVPAKTE